MVIENRAANGSFQHFSLDILQISMNNILGVILNCQVDQFSRIAEEDGRQKLYFASLQSMIDFAHTRKNACPHPCVPLRALVK